MHGARCSPGASGCCSPGVSGCSSPAVAEELAAMQAGLGTLAEALGEAGGPGGTSSTF